MRTFQYNSDPLRFHEDGGYTSESSNQTACPPSTTPESDEEEDRFAGQQPQPQNGGFFLNALAEMNANIDRNFNRLISALERSGRLPETTATAARTSGFLSKPPKRTTLSKARPPEVNKFQKAIRDYLKKLLARRQLVLDPTSNKADRFAATWDPKGDSPDCCNGDRFPIYLGGTPRHAWNASGVRVFADIMILDGHTPYGESDRLNIQKAFLERVRGLIKEYRWAQKGLAQEEERKKLDRRKHRKSDMFQRRLLTVLRSEQLRRHKELIERLGTDGMSSDEEVQISPYQRVYHVRYPRWRAPVLAVFMHTIDRMALLYRFDSRNFHGSPPHERIRPQDLGDPDIYVDGKFVPQLPRNAYNQNWLRTQPQRLLQQYVRPTEEQYEFVHDPQVYAKLTLRDAVVSSVAFSTGGDLVAAGTKSGELRIFALGTKYPPASYQLAASITALIWGKDTSSEMLFVGEINRHIHRASKHLMQQHHDFQLTTFRDMKGPITALAVSNYARLLFAGDGGRVVVYALDTPLRQALKETVGVRRGPATTLPPPSEKEDSEPVISGMKVKEGPEEVVIVVGHLEHGISSCMRASAYYVHRDNTANVANLWLYWMLGPRRGHFLCVQSTPNSCTPSSDYFQSILGRISTSTILGCYGIELYATNPVSKPDIAQYGQLVSATGLQHKNGVLPVGFLADRQWLVYGSARGNTFIIDHNTGRKVEILNDHNDPDCSVFSLATWADDDNGVERIAAGTRDGRDGSITVYEYNETIAPETPRGIPLSTSPNRDTKSPTLEEGGAPALALGYYGSRPTSSHEGPSTTTLVQPGSAHTVDPVVISGERFPHPSPMTTVFEAGTSNASPTKHTETVTSVIAITDTMTITMSPDTRTVTMAEKMTVTMSLDTMTVTMAEKDDGYDVPAYEDRHGAPGHEDDRLVQFAPSPKLPRNCTPGILQIQSLRTHKWSRETLSWTFLVTTPWPIHHQSLAERKGFHQHLSPQCPKRSLKLKTILPDPMLFFTSSEPHRQNTLLHQWSHVKIPLLTAYEEYEQSSRFPEPRSQGVWRKVLTMQVNAEVNESQEDGALPRNKNHVDAEAAKSFLMEIFSKHAPGLKIASTSSSTVSPSDAKEMLRDLSLINFRYQLISLDSILM
ncbi:hypothetical protein D9758_018481 [Tetrapyrgos nigripes]|uniref:Uncharacterized protein n=1 Tax=Tetrapyrgos nigripes TaxID=182062 RepID=A0A8H5B7A3_9AGAR|nr:hypothetical protein D9758_018481 [Tetrapyrgos nigripes]